VGNRFGRISGKILQGLSTFNTLLPLRIESAKWLYYNFRKAFPDFSIISPPISAPANGITPSSLHKVFPQAGRYSLAELQIL